MKKKRLELRLFSRDHVDLRAKVLRRTGGGSRTSRSAHNRLLLRRGRVPGRVLRISGNHFLPGRFIDFGHHALLLVTLHSPVVGHLYFFFFSRGLYVGVAEAGPRAAQSRVAPAICGQRALPRNLIPVVQLR